MVRAPEHLHVQLHGSRGTAASGASVAGMDFFRRKSPEKLVRLVGEQLDVLKASADEHAKEKVRAARAGSAAAPRRAARRSRASPRFD